MPVEPVPGAPDVFAVDTLLADSPGVMAAYLVDAERPTLVDAGAAASADVVLAGLREAGVDPTDLAHLLVTHVHLDHGGAAGALADACDATVWVHESGRPYLTDHEAVARLTESARRALGETADAYGDPTPVDPDRCRTVADGDVLELGHRRLRVHHAPGHAPHHVCAFDPDERTLFAADAVGARVGGRLYPTTPPPAFDLAANLDTVDRLAALDPERVLYGHFGPGDGDGRRAIERYGDLLVEWVETVAETRERLGGPGVDPAAVVDDLDARWLGPTVDRDVVGVCRYLDRE